MLMDILGIVIGFMAIMLLFSLLVTALVHGTQASLNLRFKNLQSALTQFFKDMDFVEYHITKVLLDKIERRYPNGLYATALPLNIPGNKIKMTSIGQQELITIINNTKDISLEQKEQLKLKVLEHFDALEEFMSQRFKQWMHQISILVAFMICFVFQLNCFALLDKLNYDSAFRHQANLVTEQLQSQPPTIKELTETPISEIQPSLQALQFEITPESWPNYYFSLQFSSLSHWLGIIFSSILISLGAPFWFNRLKDVASLRDKFSKA
ncbi:MAG: ABC transporter permease [Oceanospirillaceae bacterium]|nr:ABC transporter permease [Oceanospirillaceae bacterium]